MSIPVVVTHTGTLTNAGGDNDLLELTPADDKPIRLRRLYLSNGSEVGDAAEEMLRITVRRFGATVTSGSGGGSPTINVPDTGIGSPGVTAEGLNTTVATTTGNNHILLDIYWNIRQSPLELVWPEQDKAPTAKGAEVLLVRCESTAADDITVSITAELDEG